MLLEKKDDQVDGGREFVLVVQSTHNQTGTSSAPFPGLHRAMHQKQQEPYASRRTSLFPNWSHYQGLLEWTFSVATFRRRVRL